MGTREYHRAYYQKNKEKLQERSRAYYRENSEAALELGRLRSAKRSPDQIEKDKQKYRIWYEKNKEKLAARSKERYANDPEPIKRRVKFYKRNVPSDKAAKIGRANVLRQFHTTEEWYLAKLESQENHCALCERVREENGNRLGIDHDHSCCKKYGSCGKCLRGVLCRRCNVLVGNLEVLISLGLVLGECSGWVKKALEYLGKYRGN